MTRTEAIERRAQALEASIPALAEIRARHDAAKDEYAGDWLAHRACQDRRTLLGLISGLYLTLAEQAQSLEEAVKQRDEATHTGLEALRGEKEALKAIRACQEYECVLKQELSRLRAERKPDLRQVLIIAGLSRQAHGHDCPCPFCNPRMEGLAALLPEAL